MKPEVDAGEMLGHIKHLSSEAFGGRESGTEGARKAADYIATEFKRFALEAGGDARDGHISFCQEFPWPQAGGSGPTTVLTLACGGKQETLTAPADLMPLANRKTKTQAEGGLAFAGYGICARELKYDDFQGLDLTGQWALILRYEPQERDPKSPFAGKEYTRHASLATKIAQCLKRKAAGVLIVTGPVGRENEPDRLADPRGAFVGSWDRPVAYVTRKAADRLLAPSGKTIAGLQTCIDRDLKSFSFLVEGARVTGTAEVLVKPIRVRNVLARLPGRDAQLRNQAVLIGAHYDHLGTSGRGSALKSEGLGKLHPGANDNASGVAGLLEIAQALSALPPEKRPLRSLIFAAFTGEEKGLLGSSWYAKHPIVPLKNTQAVINMDMIGRPVNKTFSVCGLGSCRDFKAMVEKHRKASGITPHLLASNGGGSDHFTFLRAGVPALFFFCGFDPDYHRPTDTWEKIDAATARDAAQFLSGLATKMANRAEPLAFLKPEDSAFLGARLDTSGKWKGPGVPVAQVSKNSPAFLAGLKRGDVLLRFEGKDLKTADDLSLMLLDHLPGGNVKLSIKRGPQELELEVLLAGRGGPKK